MTNTDAERYRKQAEEFRKLAKKSANQEVLVAPC
jgi:hypothetical protein